MIGAGVRYRRGVDEHIHLAWRPSYAKCGMRVEGERLDPVGPAEICTACFNASIWMRIADDDPIGPWPTLLDAERHLRSQGWKIRPYNGLWVGTKGEVEGFAVVGRRMGWKPQQRS